jgi:hypothetical protein
MQASLSTVEAPSTPGTCKRVGVSAYGRVGVLRRSKIFIAVGVLNRGSSVGAAY